MGFTFKGLTSSALVSNNNASAAATDKDVADVPASYAGHTSVDGGRPDEKLGAPRANGEEFDSDEELNKVDTHAEQGVQTMQAMTHVWSQRGLYLTFAWIWLIQFCLSFISGSVSTMTPYATSTWESHSLTALTSVISSLIAGLWKLPYAKIMNIWGRPYALILGVASTTLGLIMMAACKNVQMYCAAMTFYYVGYNSIDFSVTVFVADTTKLKNRGFYIGFVASPWLITTWVYGYAVDNIVASGGIGLPWGFGIFSIVIPVVCTPLIIMFIMHQNKATREGLIQPRPSRSVLYYLKEFDVVGILILATGLALFLLAFNIYSYQADTWRSPMIICFIIIGFLLVGVFGLWEKYLAPATFIPWYLLKNRTIIFTYTMAFALYIGWYVWDSYFYSMLIVLFNQSIPHATYISNIYTMGSCFISLVYGWILRYNGRLKWYSLFWGVPLTMLGVGLMIEFRWPDKSIGYIVMCMIFIAFGGGVLVISEQTTLMAVSKQQDFPALLACESMIIAIGSAIGSTIAGAIWTGIFPVRLQQNLPADALDNLTAIYGDLTTQSSYAWGSPTREAINLSYAETQRYMLIAAVCIYSTMLVSVGLWQNVDVKKQKQRTVG
ncbi:siderophore iron transporter mirB [Massarina eburnea CBS 473.64]|uniref:Siderophore iron transporter mirB n=1 Tax=Massarina eburnea CBS 473.64 TaxID=1395130 RepID=A0A6A6RX64_9PLEO|nr:siderophore iron transporter mirB [Massarina eburnea CBS 473.64]